MGFDFGNYTNKADGTVYPLQGNNQNVNLAKTQKEDLAKPLLNFETKSVNANSLDAYANYNIGGLNVGKNVDLAALSGILTPEQVKMVGKFVTPAQQERIAAGVQARSDFYENNFLG